MLFSVGKEPATTVTRPRNSPDDWTLSNVLLFIPGSEEVDTIGTNMLLFTSLDYKNRIENNGRHIPEPPSPEKISLPLQYLGGPLGQIRAFTSNGAEKSGANQLLNQEFLGFNGNIIGYV